MATATSILPYPGAFALSIRQTLKGFSAPRYQALLRGMVAGATFPYSTQRQWWVAAATATLFSAYWFLGFSKN